jgi:transposase, IS30 family
MPLASARHRQRLLTGVVFHRPVSVPFYFATPYHSWERAFNENTNGLIRQYLPKGMCMRRIDQTDCNRIAAALNNRPRLRLGFKTPSEVLFARPGGVALQS